MNDQVLLIGIGNSSRGDDGLGWAFLDEISRKNPSGYKLEYRYQLQIEDADLISGFSKVLFVDATEEYLPNGYALEPCVPNDALVLYSHQQSPGAIFNLCRHLYPKPPSAWLLRIQGHCWDLGAGLSKESKSYLEKLLRKWPEVVGMLKGEMV